MSDTTKPTKPSCLPLATICLELHKRMLDKHKIGREELETNEFSACCVRMSDTQLILTIQLKPQKGEDASSSA